MNKTRWGAAIAAGGALTLLLAATPVLAEEATITIVPAPPGQAEATAVEIGPIKIGHAQAEAGPASDGSDSSASANSIEVNGEPLSEQTGGSQKGKGHKSGSIATIADPEYGEISLAPWSAAVADRPGGGTQSDSSAALLTIVGQGLFRVDVAKATAHAEHDGKDSKGSAVSDGVNANLADQLQIIVLHAETNSDGTGKTYIASINGNEIGNADQGFTQCPLSVPQVVDVSVNCVAASGGQGGVREVTANVLDAGIVPADGQGVSASSARGRSASGSATEIAAPAPAAAPVEPTAELPAADSAPSGQLPRTGGTIDLLAAAGAAMVALGGVLLAFGRRAEKLFAVIG